MIVRSTNISLYPIITIAVITASCILIAQALSLLLVYNFLTFDFYICVISLAFLIVGYWLNHGINLSRKDKKELRLNLLTNRERVVLTYLTEGKTNKEIAIALGVEVSTVKTHINNLYSKIKVSNRKEILEKFSRPDYQNTL